MPAMQRLMEGAGGAPPPFAPPFLKDGDVLIAQAVNILLYLGRRLGLAPRDEAGRLWADQLLTIADIVDEVHNTHRPIASSLYYEEQRAEAQRRAADFIVNRTPKYLGYFEGVRAKSSRRSLSDWTASQFLRSVAVSAGWPGCAMPFHKR